MEKVNPRDLKIGDRVIYVPNHKIPQPKNGEVGYVTKIDGKNVWVRYNGPQGNLTPVENLYKA